MLGTNGSLTFHMKSGSISSTDLDLEGLTSADSDKCDLMQLTRTEEETSTASCSSDSLARNCHFLKFISAIFLKFQADTWKNTIPRVH